MFRYGRRTRFLCHFVRLISEERSLGYDGDSIFGLKGLRKNGGSGLQLGVLGDYHCRYLSYLSLRQYYLDTLDTYPRTADMQSLVAICR